MMYKEDFGDPYTEVDFLKAKFDVTGQFPPKRAEPRGIPKSKKTGILNLLRAGFHVIFQTVGGETDIL